MIENLKTAVLEEIRAFYERNENQPGDVTVEEVGEALGRSRETARTLLEKMVKAGKMVKVTVIIDGHKRIVYRKVEPARAPGCNGATK